MKSSAQVVVVGGGVVGASVLYHLTKAGWTDVVLLERKQLTAGSTWHAAGGMHTLNGDPNVARLQQYTVNLYKEIEAESGQNCSIHLPGGLMLADTPERLDWLRMAQARGRYLGMHMDIISVAEAKELNPLLEEKYFVGALHDPDEGSVDPYGVTHAYAICARNRGAEVYTDTWVTGLQQRADGTWDVITDRDHTIHAEHVVNAGGLWAREVGRMVGLELPVLAMEHHYLMTEPMPEVIAYNQQHGRELPHMIDFAGEIYARQEGQSILLGTYEQDNRPWSPNETPWDFVFQLLPHDLDRIAPELERGFDHFPAVGRAGIKKFVNGPFTFSPDGNPLVGPIKGMRGMWVACAVMAGLSQGGGVGLSLANWMVNGDPQDDIWGMDVARYGDWATLAYTNAKVRENYSRRFRITFPNEELPGRPPAAHHPDLRPADRAQRGVGRRVRPRTSAVVPEAGQGAGRERHVPSLERLPAGRRGIACSSRARRAVRGFELRQVQGHRRGRGRLVAGPVHQRPAEDRPHEPDRDAQPAGAHRRRVLRVAHRPRRVLPVRLAGRRGAPPALVPRPPAGSRAGRSGSRCSPCRWSASRLPDRGRATCCRSSPTPRWPMPTSRSWRSARSTSAWHPVWLSRMTYTGDLGYEIWMQPEYQRYLFDLLWEAGAEFDMRLFGFRALITMRLEKNFGTWFREYRPIYTPLEAGMDRVLKFDHDFIGRAAVEAEIAAGGPKRKLTMFVVEPDPESPADVIGDEPVWHTGPTGERVVGWITSGGYAHYSGVSLAWGYIPTELAEPGTTGFEIEIIGNRRPARIQLEPVLDPAGSRMRTMEQCYRLTIR